MSACLAGLACITPLGSTPGEVWSRIVAGRRVKPEEVANPETGRQYLAARVPASMTAHLAREPRLRRASTISLLAAAAARGAMEHGAPAMTTEEKSRLAIVFGVSSGGVQYTRRFYEQVVKQGANAASPLLFPETVYNAPASHVAAMLGVDGATYTLVGDGTVGLQALQFGTQLLELGDADHVLVVAAEELDWILLEAHRVWRLTPHGRSLRAMEEEWTFSGIGNPDGTLLAEAAAAVLLSRTGPVRVTDQAARSFFHRSRSTSALAEAVRTAASGEVPELVVAGHNYTWVDRTLDQVLEKEFAKRPRVVVTPKRQLGESLGAGALLQVVLAAHAMQDLGAARALVTSVGWNQQASAAMLESGSARFPAQERRP